ncbi:MAG: acylphosphatase [Eubacterium sp.]|nr:acylphosphatase [Eubacterium sp.]
MRRSYRFYGQVQGVGFRYHASMAARGLGLTGWVRNEYDGTVTMEAQGPEPLLTQLVSQLQGDRYIDIDGVEMKEIPEREDERGFRVRML